MAVEVINATASYPDILIEFFQDVQTKEILRFESQPSKEIKRKRKKRGRKEHIPLHCTRRKPEDFQVLSHQVAY